MVRLMQRNINGLIDTKVTDLSNELREKQIDILLLQETKLISSYEVNSRAIQGYAHYHRARSDIEKTEGGGIGIWIRNSENTAHEVVHTAKKFAGIETITIEVRYGDQGERLRVTNVYNHRPDNFRKEHLDAVLPDDTATYEGAWLLAGDFNLHHPAWDSRKKDNRKSERPGKEMIEWITENGFTIENDPKKPTLRQDRIDKETNELKDKFLTSPDLTLTKGIAAQNWDTLDNGKDHFTITYELVEDEVGEPNAEYQQKYNAMKKANWTGYRQETERLWKSEYSGKKSFTLEDWQSAVKRIGGKHVPRGTRKNREPLWTPEMERVHKACEEANRELQANRTLETVTALRKADEVKVETYRSERREEMKRNISSFGKNDPRAWSFIRNRGKTRTQTAGMTLVKYVDDDEKRGEIEARFTDAKARATALVKKFQKVATRQGGAKAPRTIGCSRKRYKPFTEAELNSALRSMKKNKAPGKDEIPIEFILHLGPIGRKILLRLINRTLRTGCIPEDWRRGIIIPILKPNKKPENVMNYRPVTLTTHLSKLAERMIAKRILHHIKDKMHDDQYGFKKGRQPVDAILALVDHIARQFNTFAPYGNRGRSETTFNRTLAILIDFTSAFDTIDHAAVMQELKELGVPQHERRWVRNFLSGRKNQVKMDGSTSAWESFNSGVPQGTVLGPLLFIVAVDKLLRALDKHKSVWKCAFADDLTIYASGQTVNETSSNLQRALNEVENWTSWSKMKVNVTKTKGMVFSAAKSDSRFGTLSDEMTPKYQGQKIEITGKTEPERLLGVHLDRELTFTHHASKAAQSVKRQTAAIKAITSKDYGKTKEIAGIYADATVLQKLLFGSEAYSGLLSKTSWEEDLDRAYTMALKEVTGATSAADPHSIHMEAGTLPVHIHADMRQAIHMERIARLDPGLRKLHSRQQKTRNSTRTTREHTSPIARGKKASEFSLPSSANKYGRMEIVQHGSIPPWETKSAKRVKFIMTTTPGKKKADLTENQQRKAVETAIQKLGRCETEVWTDGSVLDEISNSAAAAFQIYQNDIEVARGTVNIPGIACSYTTETIALGTALRDFVTKLIQSAKPGDRILIATDSQSLLAALQKGPLDQTDPICLQIWEALLTLTKRGVKIILMHVYSHCGVEKNEAVDELAGETAKQRNGTENYDKIAFRDIRAKIKRSAKNQHFLEERNSKSYRLKYNSPSKWENTLSRKHQVLLTQVRTGQFAKAGTYLRKIRGDMPHSCRCCCPHEHTLKITETDTPDEDPLIQAGAAAAAPQPEAAAAAPQRKPPTANTRPCRHCGAEINRKRSMNKHIEDNHPGVRVKRIHQCALRDCDYGTDLFPELTKHYAKEHPDEEPPTPEGLVRKPSAGVTETLEHLMYDCQGHKAILARIRADEKRTKDRNTHRRGPAWLIWFWQALLDPDPP